MSKHLIFQNKGIGWNSEYRYMFWCPIDSTHYVCRPIEDARSMRRLIKYTTQEEDTLVVRGDVNEHNSDQ